MATKKRYTLAYRRKREGKTNYKKRLALLLHDKPRVVLRRSNKQFTLQLVRYRPKGDQVDVTFSSRTLKKVGWNHGTLSIPAGYLAGYAFGKKALAKGCKQAILDMGFSPSIKGTRTYAIVKGAMDAGLSIPVDESMFPSEERLQGKHLEAYGEQQKKPVTVAKDVEALKQKLDQNS